MTDTSPPIQVTVVRDQEPIPVRPRTTTAELRDAFHSIRRDARQIMAGDYDNRPVSPRQRLRYGRTVPMVVALRTQINYRRTFELGHRLKMALYRDAEFETFVERRAEMRVANHANNLRRRRAARTHRTI